MRCLVLVLAAACGSSASSNPDGQLAHDASPMQPGFRIHLDTDYTSSAPIAVHALGGYFEAESDAGVLPSLTVRIHAATLAKGTYPCARSGSNNSFDETAAVIRWFDDHTYYTNVMAMPSCTVTVDAMSPTMVSASISGTIYDEMDPNLGAHSFTASFVGTAM